MLNKCLLETLCDPDRADHFEDIFELLKLILRRLNAENAESKSVGIFLKAMVDQLRHPNEYVREHVGRLLLECTNIIEYCCIQKQDFATLTRLLVSSKEGAGSRRATAQISICEQLNVQEQPEVSFICYFPLKKYKDSGFLCMSLRILHVRVYNL